ncbi:hypothetical protein LPB137_09855 [Poseidonibacter parvus]|uniref:Spore protein YkvP/CgeB glycosyl transferase-like domain-containing protein n=1 Tax=Poseidonibacter parvus TaxID=1850254 RepID=A0A1P8KNK8_9BACT|nr:glycosyltransferase [Poseidonibacter parvus]APW66137.1 hypothetical protein LPB137_09855 [Poseidonibacter parvus]
MIKKIKYNLENYIYSKKYGKSINIDDFKIKTNNFSGNKLNIIYLTYFDSTFGINNTLKPLEEIGRVFKFQFTENPHEKDWYNKKLDVNKKMINFVKNIINNNIIDIIVCYVSGYSISIESLEELKSFNIPIINESLDDERKFKSRRGKDGCYRGVKDICSFFDLSLTTSKSAIIKYLVEGGNPIYKDYAGNERIYRKLILKKEYDVCFVGASYGIRGKYISFLRENGISVYTKGSGWEEGFAEADEMIEIFNKAKIVLGFSTVGKNDDINILKGRDFEVPLIGSFYITGYHEELKEYFTIGKDIETYMSKEDLLAKVKYYLLNDEERESIARKGYEKCLNHYTAKKSYEKVFGHLGL